MAMLIIRLSISIARVRLPRHMVEILPAHADQDIVRGERAYSKTGVKYQWFT